jgi:hypothetical protein
MLLDDKIDTMEYINLAPTLYPLLGKDENVDNEKY